MNLPNIDNVDEEAIHRALSLMRARGVVFEDGLSETEIQRIEATFEFRFPPDLRTLLLTVLPVSFASDACRRPFPIWRSEEAAALRDRLQWPIEGIAFDIENNKFWIDEWGMRPANTSDAVEVARMQMETAPKLIPVYSHRYIPAEPCAAGNPVFSIHQADIIYYGQNLWDYIEQEFGDHADGWYAGERYADFTPEQYQSCHKHIRFWSDLVS